ncbi:MAG: ribonuclease III domain-containing protein [Eubacteriales bacterium]|nr:ribonuclease III domain-containing protein [Eubacteriales bacterium]MDD4389602.1 ribonuclease III domain-containing protein [Eubacteriales bacterium]
MDVKQINTTALAYIGDAVYEIYARMHVLSDCPNNVDALHRKAVGFVCAEAQAKAIKALMKSSENSTFFVLTEEERDLVKRARNRKIATKAKNADPVTYKWATAFEALVGYLYLDSQKERLDLLAEASLKIISKEKGECNE